MRAVVEKMTGLDSSLPVSLKYAIEHGGEKFQNWFRRYVKYYKTVKDGLVMDAEALGIPEDVRVLTLEELRESACMFKDNIPASIASTAILAYVCEQKGRKLAKEEINVKTGRINDVVLEKNVRLVKELRSEPSYLTIKAAYEGFVSHCKTQLGIDSYQRAYGTRKYLKPDFIRLIPLLQEDLPVLSKSDRKTMFDWQDMVEHLMSIISVEKDKYSNFVSREGLLGFYIARREKLLGIKTDKIPSMEDAKKIIEPEA